MMDKPAKSTEFWANSGGIWFIYLLILAHFLRLEMLKKSALQRRIVKWDAVRRKLAIEVDQSALAEVPKSNQT